MSDQSIFGLRFGSNAELNPTGGELGAFITRAKRPGTLKPLGSAFAPFRELLHGLAAFGGKWQQDARQGDMRERMFYGVVGHSQFAHPALMLAVEHYEYHFHALAALDFRKPAAFIKSAEEEMERLNPKKKDDAARLERFRAMVEERKRAIGALNKRKAALVEELRLIALYIRDNLVRIRKRCEASIVILVERQLSRKEEQRLVEDIREHLGLQFQERGQGGEMGGKGPRIAEQDAAVLTSEVSALLRADVFALTALYEAIHEHAGKAVRAIDLLTAEAAAKKNRTMEDELDLFARMEGALASLVTEFRFEMSPAAVRSETAHGRFLLEKREELLNGLFAVLKRERRARSDRRRDEDRRRFTDPNFKGVDLRRGKERRSEKSRRT